MLVVAGRTPSLDDDVADMGLRWEDPGGGYWRLPIEVLRLLPEEYLRSLSAEVQAEIRRRIGQAGH